MTHDIHGETRTFGEANVPLTDGELRDLRRQLRAPYVERASDGRMREHLEEGLAELDQRVGGDQPDEHARDGGVVVVFGRSGAGKTHAVQRLLQGTTRLARSECGRLRPCIRLSVKAPATLRSMGLDLLDLLGYPLSAEVKEAVVWNKVRKHLKRAKTQVVVFDEFQNCSSRANVEEATRIRDTIRSLLVSDHPIVLILVGLPEVVDFLRVDDQVRRRGRFTALETLDIDDADLLAANVRKLAAKTGVTVGDDFGAEIAPRLLHAAGGQLGLAIEMSIEAILRALRPLGPIVGANGEERTGWHPPRDRLLLEDYGRMYEDRTDNMWFANIFHPDVEDWTKIDPTLVGIHLPSQLERCDEHPKRAAKGRAGRKGRGK